MFRTHACLLLLTSAGAHQPLATTGARAPMTTETRGVACVLPPLPPPAELIREHGTVLEAYRREGGVWLEHAPILINEDFDFALAMGLEDGVGVGLAAAKRAESNARKAAALGEIALPAALRRRLASCAAAVCTCTSCCGARIPRPCGPSRMCRRIPRRAM